MLEQFCTNDPDMASALYAQEVLKKHSVCAYVGQRGVAQDVYPSISEYLDSLLSKHSVLELLCSSQEFTRSLLELCLEISLDQ